MTEQEWLDDATDCRDLLAWLTGVRPRGLTAPYQIQSARKYRLLACAIWRLADLGRINWWNGEALIAAERDAEGLEPPEKMAAFHREISDALLGEILTRPSAVDALHSLVLKLFPHVGDCRGDADGWQVADQIRQHIGNPWRPVTLPLGEKCGACKGHGCYRDDWSPGDETVMQCKTCHGAGHGPSPVLTPLVVSLAEAAYTQRQPDGTLHDDALAVLWDALEESGCPGEVSSLNCDGTGTHRHEGRAGEVIHGVLHDSNPRQLHHHHDDQCRILRQPHPLRAALQSPGPHYPGFWALDVVLNKE